MVFNCVELLAQQLRKFSATVAVAVVASSCAKGRCLTELLMLWTVFMAVCYRCHEDKTIEPFRHTE